MVTGGNGTAEPSLGDSARGNSTNGNRVATALQTSVALQAAMARTVTGGNGTADLGGTAGGDGANGNRVVTTLQTSVALQMAMAHGVSPKHMKTRFGPVR